jgi:hypothetical protein
VKPLRLESLAPEKWLWRSIHRPGNVDSVCWAGGPNSSGAVFRQMGGPSPTPSKRPHTLGIFLNREPASLETRWLGIPKISSYVFPYLVSGSLNRTVKFWRNQKQLSGSAPIKSVYRIVATSDSFRIVKVWGERYLCLVNAPLSDAHARKLQHREDVRAWVSGSKRGGCYSWAGGVALDSRLMS